MIESVDNGEDRKPEVARPEDIPPWHAYDGCYGCRADKFATVFVEVADLPEVKAAFARLVRDNMVMRKALGVLAASDDYATSVRASRALDAVDDLAQGGAPTRVARTSRSRAGRDAAQSP